jgi:2-oxoglutarate dehydrogenase E2 component (dihydrolipoamide succinyltransferase)
MTIEINVPEMGESVLEATVHQWFKKEGEFVTAGEALVELETDKVNLEVGAKGSGVLARILAPEGQDVKVGDALGVIDEAQQQPGAAASPAAASPDEGDKPAQAVSMQGADEQAVEKKRALRATPLASRLAQEQKVDLAQVDGTGPEGKVTKSDVEQYVQTRQTTETEAPRRPSPPEPPPPADAGRIFPAQMEVRQRMSRRRRTIAERLLEAKQSTAMLTTFNEIDMAAVMDLRRRHNEDFQARYGLKLGIASFFIKAGISALKRFPQLNAEIQGDEIVLKRYYDIGVAIGAEEGLVVPVIRSAERLSFAEIEHQIKQFAAKSEQGALSIEDLRGGTFTITNGGIFGSLFSTPILNIPQVGILGLHTIADRPVALNGEVVIRPMMYVALSYDHRLVDGREAVQFLVHIKKLIEDPERFFLEG